MRSPYLITEPTTISFSGGRSSAYMTHRVLDANNGLPDGSNIVFANTGKEHPSTLDFVRDCSDHWGVDITWVEYPHGIISPDNASTNGEPFAAMIRKKKHLPNRVMRFCTSELKVNLINQLGCKMHMIGIRADEQRRAAKIHNATDKSGRVTICPLWEGGISENDVMYFWSTQPFDLAIPPTLSNCDLCFLKGKRKRIAIARSNPPMVDWWADMEREIDASFDHTLPHTSLKLIATDGQIDLFDNTEFACFCGD